MKLQVVSDSIRLLRYDVFTDVAFTGNPLAVAIDPPPLSEAQHQRIAAELNLSETVFLRRRRDGDGWDTRIFTPSTELPFAGHPTVGAAVALADEGLARQQVVLHEGVGPVAVDLEGAHAMLTTPAPPSTVPVADPGDVAASLGLTLGDLHPDLGPRGWSAGVPFTIVAVRDVDTLSRIHLDQVRWSETVALTPAADLYVLAPVDSLRGERWRARMFAPGLGITEDPATGAAAAASCGFLIAHAGPERARAGWTIEQGVEMGRRSEIRVGAVLRGTELVAVTVGGTAVRVGEGSLRIPTAG